uniref:hypothetical protein n=1 Tax=Bartonella capreoli TaxID=155192 RepID=UPI001ABBE60D
FFYNLKREGEINVLLDIIRKTYIFRKISLYIFTSLIKQFVRVNKSFEVHIANCNEGGATVSGEKFNI